MEMRPHLLGVEKAKIEGMTPSFPSFPSFSLERWADIHLAFLQLGCVLISLRFLG